MATALVIFSIAAAAVRLLRPKLSLRLLTPDTANPVTELTLLGTVMLPRRRPANHRLPRFERRPHHFGLAFYLWEESRHDAPPSAPLP